MRLLPLFLLPCLQVATAALGQVPACEDTVESEPVQVVISVIDSTTGNGIPDASVLLGFGCESESYITDTLGRVLLSLPVGTWRWVEAARPGFLPIHTELEVGEHESEAVRVALLDTARSAVIGRVTDAQTGNHAHPVRLKFDPPGRWADVMHDGSFGIALPPGTYRADFTSPSYFSDSVTVEVLPETASRLDVRLDPVPDFLEPVDVRDEKPVFMPRSLH